MTYNQGEFDIRCEWGRHGVIQLAPHCDAVVIVDVLSFSTCVSVAVANGATVIPYRWKDDSVTAFAEKRNAEAAGRRGCPGYSLSPASLGGIPSGTRLVLPSPNGAALSMSTGATPTFAGCLRNAKAVAAAAQRCGPKIAVIPAGERWSEDDSLRPAFEDLMGAGAIICYLQGTCSPEARLAAESYRALRSTMVDSLKACSSGKELCERGYERDVVLSGQCDADACAPILVEGAYKAALMAG